MLAQFLNEQLVSIFLVVGFFLRLKLRSRITDRRMRHFYTAVFCCALLILSELLEEYAAQDPSDQAYHRLFVHISHDFTGFHQVAYPMYRMKQTGLWRPYKPFHGISADVAWYACVGRCRPFVDGSAQVMAPLCLDYGMTVWNDGDIDIAPEELYKNGVAVDRADIA